MPARQVDRPEPTVVLRVSSHLLPKVAENGHRLLVLPALYLASDATADWSATTSGAAATCWSPGSAASPTSTAGSGSAATRARSATCSACASRSSTRPDEDSYWRLLGEAARRAGGRSWLFLLNHTDRPQRVPATSSDLRTGEPVTGTVTVPAGGVVILRELPG